MKNTSKLILLLLATILANNILAQANDGNAKQLIRDAYKKFWNIDVPEPFYLRGPIFEYYNNIKKTPGIPSGVDLDEKDGWEACVWDFKTKTKKEVFLTLSGKTYMKEDVCIVPRGDIRTVSFIVDNGKTDLPKNPDRWDQQVTNVNKSWTDFATKQGSTKSYATLKNVTFVVAEGQIPEYGRTSSSELKNYLSSKGYSVSDFDVFIFIKLNPEKPDGCYAGANEISMNHFFSASTKYYTYSTQEMDRLGATAFSHELGHLFGWNHRTVQSKFTDKYIQVDPGYYGWRDTDGDGIVEALDPTPYGMGGGTTPTAPSSLKSSNVTNNSASLSWADNSNNESGFKIERKTGSKWTEIAKVGANIKSYKNTGLTASKDYSYRVRAYNSKGNSSYSNTINITTKK